MILKEDKEFYVEVLENRANLDLPTAEKLVAAMAVDSGLKAAFDHWYGCISDADNTMDIMLEHAELL